MTFIDRYFDFFILCNVNFISTDIIVLFLAFLFAP